MIHPLISAAIPHYNKEEYILSFVNSVLTQSYFNYEVIVIDCELKIGKGLSKNTVDLFA